jgi:haloalkane dehalogenase
MMLDQNDSGPAWVDRTAFPFASRFVQTSAGRLHYVDEGPRDAAPVLLVHGTPSWSFEYRHVIARLAQSRRVIAIDHLGFGLSERPQSFDYSPEAHARVLREAVERLGLERFSLVVHDYGGPIALPLAIEAPERIESLVVLNSWMWDFGSEPQFVKATRLMATAFGRFMYRFLNASLRLIMPLAYAERRRLTRAIHSQYLAPFRDRDARVRVLWALARALTSSARTFQGLWAARAKLAQIPALVVWGLGDRALPPSMLERWREALPEARVVPLQGIGHWPQEEAPEAVAEALDGFLPRAAGVRAKLAGA